MEPGIWTIYAKSVTLIILAVAAAGGALVTFVVKSIIPLGGDKYKVDVRKK